MEALKVFVFMAAYQFARYLLVAGGAYLYFWKGRREGLQGRRLQKPALAKGQIRREMKNSAVTSVIFSFFLSIPVLEPLKPFVRIYHAPLEHGILWLVLTVPFLMIVQDTYFYWMHRLVHHPVLFKHIHLEHHRSNNPDPMTAYSFHPVEAVLEMIWIVPLFFLVPMYLPAVILFSFFAIGMNVVGHLGFEMYPAWFARHPVMMWLNTSTHHNKHHKLSRGNYALYFTFWDKAMGTELAQNPESAPPQREVLV